MDEALLEPIEEEVLEQIDEVQESAEVPSEEPQGVVVDRNLIYPPREIPFELLDFDASLPELDHDPIINCANPELASTQAEKNHSIYLNVQRLDMRDDPRFIIDVSMPNHVQTPEHYITRIAPYAIYLDDEGEESPYEIDHIDLHPGSKLNIRFIGEIAGGIKFGVRAICNKDGVWDAVWPMPQGLGIYSTVYIEDGMRGD